jgi:hypothetical protein
MTLTEKIRAIEQEWQSEIERQKVCEQSLLEREEAARQLGLRVAQAALESLMAESGTGYEGSYLACKCGGRMKYQRDAERPVRSLIGEVRYERAYYYCRECGSSRCPLDEKFGQGAREISAGVERQLALLSAHLTFATAAGVLREITGVEISARQAETVAEDVGDQAERRSQQEADEAARRDLAPRPHLRLVGAAERTWVIEMDGVMGGLKSGEWQEIKVGVIYELGQRVEISKHRWELLDKQRCAVRGNAEEFRKRLWATLIRVGAQVGDRIVVIADGAEWIEQTVEELFAGAIRILDFYHAAERVWAVANGRYGEGTLKASAWAETKIEALKAGRVSDVCRAMRRLEMPKAEAKEVCDNAVRYFERHRHQMAYDRYRAEGLPIGSGAVEGSCKHLVTARCKQSGMRWTEDGLSAIVALRCWTLNDRLDELCPKPKVKIEWAKAA